MIRSNRKTDSACAVCRSDKYTEAMCLTFKVSCNISLRCVICPSLLYEVHSAFLTWHTTPPGICLPCLTGHLTLLSLRLCCHGNSSVTGLGWAWGMSCGVMARFLQWRGGGNGRWETSKTRQRCWWKAERSLTWKRRSREYLLSLCSKACCHCV